MAPNLKAVTTVTIVVTVASVHSRVARMLGPQPPQLAYYPILLTAKVTTFHNLNSFELVLGICGTNHSFFSSQFCPLCVLLEVAQVQDPYQEITVGAISCHPNCLHRGDIGSVCQQGYSIRRHHNHRSHLVSRSAR